MGVCRLPYRVDSFANRRCKPAMKNTLWHVVIVGYVPEYSDFLLV